MKKPVEAIRDKKMGWLLASKIFGVQQATHRTHLLGTNKTLESNSKALGCWKATFLSDVESQLVPHIKFLDSRLFGLTRASVQELAVHMAEKNGFAHIFNIQKQKGRQDWLNGPLRRNKHISLRKPEATSAARAQAINRPQVQKSFQLYGSLLEYDGYTHRIYNPDESGLSKVQKPENILGTKVRKQVVVITSGEWSKHHCCLLL
ncbi:unnamed protein product [Acanthoscelides obtectus]|uniref:Uncharacterized protein n=1 Tax=Acanthoscelides obtectus TaxID=200917 RepID=A0A9P0P806_ACAOB|nr:unnamed protein product [Acanthoscelides obtectus]CAK1651930.1 hypothetical protein AOBTE_LOCUS17552 [Acanthoscelides obtectus]